MVALRMESVGRNYTSGCEQKGIGESLSAWRAWVEMLPTKVFPKPISRSLSAWRAWVEIIVDSR